VGAIQARDATRPRRSDTAEDGLMGALLSAECSTCGYGTEIYAGFGFAGIEFEPHVCDRCRAIVDVVIAMHLSTPDGPGLNRCPNCGGDRVHPLRYELAGFLDKRRALRRARAWTCRRRLSEVRKPFMRERCRSLGLDPAQG
jgi:hypothetical protein